MALRLTPDLVFQSKYMLLLHHASHALLDNISYIWIIQHCV